jgi:serralysin
MAATQETVMTTIHGTNGNDQISEDRYGGETIYTYGGDDVVNLWVNDDFAGVYLVDTGDGNDVVQQSFNGSGSFLLGAGNDTFYSEGDDTWSYEVNYVDGGTGNDTFVVDTQASYYWGGEGNDGFYGTGWSNRFDGGVGWDFVSYEYAESAMTINLTAGTAARGIRADTILNVEAARGTLYSDILIGNHLDNTLEGMAGDDQIDGGGGADYLWGGAGADTIWGGFGNDSLYGEAGRDTLRGDAGTDWLYGGLDNDSLIGGDGDDQLFGEAGNDTLQGDAGRDRLTGGVGNDSLSGGADNDTLHGEAGNDTLQGDAGTDELQGDEGDDVLRGGAGGDLLYGDDGADLLFGDADGDLIYGGAGDDRLNGGAGRDVLLGDAGADRFIYLSAADSGRTADSRDIIRDFVRGADKIDLSGIDANSGLGGDQAMRFVTSYTGSTASAANHFTGGRGEIVVARSAAETIVMIDLNGDDVADMHIALTGNIALTASDFIL